MFLKMRISNLEKILAIGLVSLSISCVASRKARIISPESISLPTQSDTQQLEEGEYLGGEELTEQDLIDQKKLEKYVVDEEYARDYKKDFEQYLEKIRNRRKGMQYPTYSVHENGYIHDYPFKIRIKSQSKILFEGEGVYVPLPIIGYNFSVPDQEFVNLFKASKDVSLRKKALVEFQDERKFNEYCKFFPNSLIAELIKNSIPSSVKKNLKMTLGRKDNELLPYINLLKRISIDNNEDAKYFENLNKLGVWFIEIESQKFGKLKPISIGAMRIAEYASIKTAAENKSFGVLTPWEYMKKIDLDGVYEIEEIMRDAEEPLKPKRNNEFKLTAEKIVYDPLSGEF